MGEDLDNAIFVDDIQEGSLLLPITVCAPQFLKIWIALGELHPVVSVEFGDSDVMNRWPSDDLCVPLCLFEAVARDG